MERTEPSASRTAREVKFSDAMRTREERCRAFSCSMRRQRSGSTSERCLLRLAPAEEEDRERRARQRLMCVDDDAADVHDGALVAVAAARRSAGARAARRDIIILLLISFSIDVYYLTHVVTMHAYIIIGMVVCSLFVDFCSEENLCLRHIRYQYLLSTYKNLQCSPS